MSELLDCPFCKERDFNLPGLKYHIERYCQEYPKVADIMAMAKAQEEIGGPDFDNDPTAGD